MSDGMPIGNEERGMIFKHGYEEGCLDITDEGVTGNGFTGI